MLFDLPPPVPARELEESRLERAYGLDWLVVVVRRVARVKKDGEVVYRDHATRYLVERPAAGVVRLVCEKTDAGTGEAKVYTVTAFSCDCPDAEIRGRERQCKHRTSLIELGLLETGPDGSGVERMG